VNLGPPLVLCDLQTGDLRRYIRGFSGETYATHASDHTRVASLEQLESFRLFGSFAIEPTPEEIECPTN
jgi:hypothetical protein